VYVILLASVIMGAAFGLSFGTQSAALLCSADRQPQRRFAAQTNKQTNDGDS
jgi:hypothetical protein